MSGIRLIFCIAAGVLIGGVALNFYERSREQAERAAEIKRAEEAADAERKREQEAKEALEKRYPLEQWMEDMGTHAERFAKRIKEIYKVNSFEQCREFLGCMDVYELCMQRPDESDWCLQIVEKCVKPCSQRFRP